MTAFYDDTLYIHIKQNGFCGVFDKLVEDDSYAYLYVMIGKGHLKTCPRYQNCEVVRIPYTEGPFSGGLGWMFPKRSPFLQPFTKYYWELKEAGHLLRILATPEYSPTQLLPPQECDDFDMNPIGMHKVISLFTMFFVAVFFCSAIFW